MSELVLPEDFDSDERPRVSGSADIGRNNITGEWEEQNRIDFELLSKTTLASSPTAKFITSLSGCSEEQAIGALPELFIRMGQARSIYSLDIETRAKLGNQEVARRFDQAAHDFKGIEQKLTELLKVYPERVTDALCQALHDTADLAIQRGILTALASRNPLPTELLKWISAVLARSVPPLESEEFEYNRDQISLCLTIANRQPRQLASLAPLLINSFAYFEDQLTGYWDANRALVAMGRENPHEIYALLVAGLGSSEPRVQMGSAGTIGAFGKKAESAVPHLLALLESTQPGMRRNAISSLGQICKGGAAVGEALLDLLESDPSVNGEIIEALGGVAEPRERIVRLYSELWKQAKTEQEDKQHGSQFAEMMEIVSMRMASKGESLEESWKGMPVDAESLLSGVASLAPLDPRAATILTEASISKSRVLRELAASSLGKLSYHGDYAFAAPYFARALNDEPNIVKDAIFEFADFGEAGRQPLIDYNSALLNKISQTTDPEELTRLNWLQSATQRLIDHPMPPFRRILEG